jgi:hypothetical protein
MATVIDVSEKHVTKIVRIYMNVDETRTSGTSGVLLISTRGKDLEAETPVK